MQKKIYSTPRMEIIHLETLDILTSSIAGTSGATSGIATTAKDYNSKTQDVGVGDSTFSQHGIGGWDD